MSDAMLISVVEVLLRKAGTVTGDGKQDAPQPRGKFLGRGHAVAARRGGMRTRARAGLCLCVCLSGRGLDAGVIRICTKKCSASITPSFHKGI